VKKLIKENKVLFVLAIVIIIALVAMVIGLLSYFYGNEETPYGDRLDGIDKFPISKKIDKEIKSLYETGVESVEVDIRGKIIYIILDVSNGISKADARSMAVKALDKFNDEEKDFYDIQFLVTCETAAEKTSIYPMQGLKRAKIATVSWTNN